jgi:hypothetical protein
MRIECPFARLLPLMTLALLAGCQSKPAAPLSFAAQVGQAHGIDEWRSRPALVGDLFVQFEGQETLWMRFVHEMQTRRTRMTLEDGTVMVFDGQKAWIAPASAAFQPVRATLLNWPYFINLPFKLQDAGTQLTPLPPQKLGETMCSTARFLHGDRPGLWNLLYTDPKSHRLLGVAYGPEGELETRAITYYDFQHLGGALIATEWRIWNWRQDQGIYGRPVGTGKLLNLELTWPKKGAFDRPANARECHEEQK